MLLAKEYYQCLSPDVSNQPLITLLLSHDLNEFNKGLNEFSNKISSHIGERALKKYCKNILASLIKQNAFSLENEEFLLPEETLIMVESCIYLEILYDEFLVKTGRRGFFLSDFKKINPLFTYFCFEFLLAKVSSLPIKSLLALAKGLQFKDMGIISKWSFEARVEIYVKLTRIMRVGIFQDETFLGFMSKKRINDVEDIINIVMEDISMLKDWTDDKGYYFETFGNVKAIKELPKFKKKESAKKAKPKVIATVSPIELNLRILKLKKMPADLKELKKHFYKLALANHPDKFEHRNDGTKTKLLINNKFRAILCAYEFIEKEILK